MANRYWVGGTGGWNTTSTTNWSATSGGASGASVPTLVDDVFFDTLSNLTAYTVTISSGAVAVSCRSLSISGPATGNVTVSSNGVFNVAGSLTIAATGVTWSSGNTMQFAATTTGWTITTNGVTVNPVSFTGVGGGWTLGSAFTTSSNFTFSAGTFSTANFNFTVTNNFTSTGASSRTLNLGSSAISCGSWNCLGATNLTLNAGTSTITVTGLTFNGGGLTYYNYFKTQNGFNIGDGGNTFNAVTMNTVTTSGTFQCTFAGNQTIGTLTINGGSNALARASIQTPATLVGTQITLTVASFVTNGFIDFRDINFAGAASPLTVSTGGDCGNNANITLATPKTVYWNLVAGGNLTGSTGWALTSGGAPAVANYPRAQDTAIIGDTGLNSGATLTFNITTNTGTVNISSRTLPMTLAVGANNIFIYGDLTLSSAVTTTATTGLFTFSGYNKTQTITSAGVSFANTFIVNNPTVTVTLANNLTTTSATAFSVLSGTLNLNGKTLTSSLFSSTGSLVRNITFGGGTMTVSGATFTASGSNFTTSGTGTISMTRASSKTFAGGGFLYPTLNQGGAGALVITGANTFADITNTVQPATITFPASTITRVANFSANGTLGNLITINSSSAGTQATLTYTGTSTVSVGYLSIKDSNATPGVATWYAGENSVNVSNNNGWFFTNVPSLMDMHDGGGRKKSEAERKKFAAKNKQRRDEIIAAFELIIEGKPQIAEEIAESFIIVQATEKTPMVINYDGLLNSLDRVDKIYSTLIDMDDEDVLLLL